MKKQLSWLMPAGALLMGFPLLTSIFYAMPGSIADFIKGVGVGIIIASFFVQVWHSKTMRKEHS
jgi:hypothetical protein